MFPWDFPGQIDPHIEPWPKKELAVEELNDTTPPGLFC